MYAYADQGDSADNYQRSVRDRASVSLHDLEDVLYGTGASPNTTAAAIAKDKLKSTVQPRTLNWYEDKSRPQKYKNAANQLGEILSTSAAAGQEEPQRMEAPKMPVGYLPSPEEAATMLQSQTSYIHQLENENRYIKEELFFLKSKVGELLDENKRLHEELKKSVLQEILGVEGDLTKVDDSFILDEDKRLHSRDIRNLQIELERLSSLHASRTNRLEAQLSHSREEIQKYEQMVEDLRSQLRMRDTVPTRDDGLVIDMSMLSDENRIFHKQTIERLIKERDELMDHITSLKGQNHELKAREEESYQQVKQGVQLVEQTQFEQKQALWEKEQLREELENMKKRFDILIADTQVKMQEDRDMVRKENAVIIEELSGKIKEIGQQNAALVLQMEKVSREKVSLIGEVDELKLQIKRYDRESAVSTDSFRAESTNASIRVSQSQQEVRRLRGNLETLQKAKDQERSRFETELDDLRRRLTKAERELVNSKEECIHMTTNTQALERELHLAKLARDSIERGRNEDLKAMSSRALHREEELNSFIEDMEEKHTHTAQEMDTMIKKQNKFIGRLRDECKRQAAQIETLTKRNRTQCGNLKKQNEELRMRLERAVARLSDLESQSDQHARVHEKMKERLKTVDDQSQNQSQQILELLSKNSKATRDRQLLAREVEFLRKEIAKSQEEDLQKFFSSNKPLVDEILTNVTAEDRIKKVGFIPEPDSKLISDDLSDT